jgi:hypothetical protein
MVDFRLNKNSMVDFLFNFIFNLGISIWSNKGITETR